MDEITLDDKTYVSSKRAAQITGYAKDYVGQLCREGRVEARLVGRNWYVLETSIREHRFGAPASVAGSGRGEVIEEIKAEMTAAAPVATPETTASETGAENWQPSSYSAEELTPLPTLAPAATQAGFETTVPLEERPGIRVFEENFNAFAPTPAPEPVVTPEPVAPSVVEEMQSAWQDWFKRTNELAVSEETLLENPEPEFALEAPEEDEELPMPSMEAEVPINVIRTATEPVRRAVEMHDEAYEDKDDNEDDEDEDDQSSFDKVTTPITLEKHTYQDEEEERIPLKRSYGSISNSQPVSRPAYPTQNASIYTAAPVKSLTHSNGPGTVPEGRVIRERRVVTKKGKPSLALQVLMLSVAALAAIVAVIGTGKLDTLFSRENLNYAPINYLVGQSSVEKGK